MASIGLTSPLTRGPEVERAQRHLKVNEFGEFYRGPIDGKFDEETANASERARWLLGFPQDRTRGRYSETLDLYLTGTIPLTRIMRVRRRARLKELAKRREARRSIKARALEVALREKGTNEQPPGSNRVKYSEWYGITGPWCAMFVTWCLVQAAEDLRVKTDFSRGVRYAYTPYMEADARHRNHGMAVTNDPEPGDLVLYQFDSDSQVDHVGFFIRWQNRSAGTFLAVEGNTSLTSNDNGGEVMIRDRSRSLVRIFIKLDD